MELIILGSGGATPTPKPFCQRATCIYPDVNFNLEYDGMKIKL